MDMSEFARISNQNQCPVCFGSNINKDKYRGGWGARISACDDCGGVPALCSANGESVVYVSTDITVCPICGEQSPSAATHMIHINT
jgi:RNA polymerase subunit RPABC4/transcription elongation factor Spt4